MCRAVTAKLMFQLVMPMYIYAGVLHSIHSVAADFQSCMAAIASRLHCASTANTTTGEDMACSKKCWIRRTAQMVLLQYLYYTIVYEPQEEERTGEYRSSSPVVTWPPSQAVFIHCGTLQTRKD